MVELVSSETGQFAVIRPGESVGAEFEANYWAQVRRALQEVFDWNAERALSDTEALRNRVKALSSDATIYFYHSAPLQIAADMAGVDKVTDEHTDRFRRISGAHRDERPNGSSVQVV